jgi:hypothetical protein
MENEFILSPTNKKIVLKLESSRGCFAKDVEPRCPREEGGILDIYLYDSRCGFRNGGEESPTSYAKRTEVVKISSDALSSSPYICPVSLAEVL